MGVDEQLANTVVVVANFATLAIGGTVALTKLGSSAVKLIKAGELGSTALRVVKQIPKVPASAGKSILAYGSKAKKGASAFGKGFMAELSKGGASAGFNGAGDLSRVGKATVAGAKEAKSVLKAASEQDELLKIMNGVENGDIPLTNNFQKGNYGEMKMDKYFEDKGYTRISKDRVTSLNQKGHQGIDGVYYKPDGNPPYVIAEAKYGSSKLGKTNDGKQMSEDWLKGVNSGRDKLAEAVGLDLAEEIRGAGYGSELVKVSDKGLISSKLLDASGKVVK
ncbi:hypothetical protein RyT2_28830 [Pseudolactococcus yaeyamensis]